MTIGELVAIMGAIGALIASMASFVTALVTYARLSQVHEQINGQSAALLELTRKESFAAGQLAGPPEGGLPK